MKIKYSFLITVLVLLITSINFSILYLFIPGPLEKTETLIIAPKLSIKEISAKLKEHKIIYYSSLFEFIAKLYSLNNTMKSGEYSFTTKISPFQVIKILSNGKSIIHKLIIPEGSTIYEIIKKINEENRLFGEIKTKVPEGFLMPSTYFFSYGDSKEQIIDQMRRLMSSNLDKIMDQLPADSQLKTRLDVLTLASIIEKESSLESEKALIASIFLNRLKKGMKLQACPTVIYAITQGKFRLNRSLSRQDLAIKSPYNTYYVPRLPIGPICCPGEKSLYSIINPTKTDSLYFVVDGNGGHNFSNNLRDHNKNLQTYKKNRELLKQTNDANLNPR